MSVKKILIMAGGTGGHVFPALAVAKALQEQGVEIEWLGTARGLENDLVPRERFPLHRIAISGLRGNGWRKWIMAPFGLLRALMQARRIIKSVNPDVVLGMGGFVSGPGGIAAWLARKPLVIHEQNSIAGLTNRGLGFLANATLEAFPNTFPKIYRRVIETGNPVRPAIAELAAPTQRFQERKGRLRLLILGGSQGAQVINQTMPTALSMLDPGIRPEVWHQTGSKGFEETRRNYQILGLSGGNIVPFIDEIEQAYAWADLVLCRAGALTVSELAAAGVGSILIPYPHSVDNHQLYNAKFLAQKNAAIILLQKDFTAARIAGILQKFCQNRTALLTMAESARQLHHPNALQDVTKICLNAPPTKLTRNKLTETKEKNNERIT